MGVGSPKEIIGGTQAPTTALWTDGEIYDPASDSWTLTPPSGGPGILVAASSGSVR